MEGPLANLLDQLGQMTVVVANSGDINSIKKFRPRDATTNPSLITAAAQMPEYQGIVDGALRWAQREAAGGAVIPAAIDRLSVEFGLQILEIVPGRVETEIFGKVIGDMERAQREFYDGFESLQVEDIVGAVAYALETPRHVNIGHIEILPTFQVPGGLNFERRSG